MKFIYIFIDFSAFSISSWFLPFTLQAKPEDEHKTTTTKQQQQITHKKHRMFYVVLLLFFLLIFHRKPTQNPWRERD